MTCFDEKGTKLAERFLVDIHIDAAKPVSLHFNSPGQDGEVNPSIQYVAQAAPLQPNRL